MNTGLLSNLDQVVVSVDSWEIGDSLLHRFGIHVQFTIVHRDPVPDDQSSEDAVCHALDHYPDYEHAMLLQCTAPGLKFRDINAALDLYDGEHSVVAVRQFDGYIGVQVPPEDANDPTGWYPISPETIGDQARPHTRQLNEPRYIEAGSLYLAPASAWRAGNRYTSIIHMIEVPRWRSVEIDDMQDLLSWRRCQDLWMDPKWEEQE